MRGEGITGPDPTVQVLIFRDMVRTEGLLCVRFLPAVSSSELHFKAWEKGGVPPSYSTALQLLADPTPACKIKN